ncbi:hypothetical protein [Shinella oryzae]|uniref:hypothetical protein n=1 Tax=Shinella oryzae TaxID=2871820 RepID=UPI001FF166FB|nr:hypothetical protein [Shinella oryzae]UPA26584.1 hypothetical protein K6301_21760 [Shinella oryzae]
MRGAAIFLNISLRSAYGASCGRLDFKPCHEWFLYSIDFLFFPIDRIEPEKSRSESQDDGVCVAFAAARSDGDTPVAHNIHKMGGRIRQSCGICLARDTPPQRILRFQTLYSIIIYAILFFRRRMRHSAPAINTQ